MALRSFSAAKTVSTFIASEISGIVTRRGFAAASQGVVSRTEGSEESHKNSWGPDPVTGYYRPDNLPKEIDVAELRQRLINNKTSSH